PTGNGSPEDVGQVLPPDNLLEMLGQGLAGVRFAAAAGGLTLGQLVPQFVQGLDLLGQVLADAAQLALEQALAAGDDDGPRSTEDFLGGPVNPGLAEACGQTAEAIKGNGQQMGMVAGVQVNAGGVGG